MRSRRSNLKLAQSAMAIACLAMPLAAHADAAPTCAVNSTKPDIAGIYVDNYGGLQEVASSVWISGPLVFEICSVDNAKHQIIAHNSTRNQYNPDKYSRFDWTTSRNRLWYCQTVYDAASPEQAASAPAPDTLDPRTHGCGQSEWSTLVRLSPQ